MAIGADGARPLAGVALPDSCVVLQSKAQVIVDEILARCLHAAACSITSSA